MERVIGETAQVVYARTEVASIMPTEFKSSDLLLAATDGSWECQLTRTDDAEIFPTWSPDGTRIAFERVRKCRERVDVVVLDLATGHETLIGHGDGRVNQLAWSTTGEFLRLRGATACWQDFNERVFEVAMDGYCVEGETELECRDRRESVAEYEAPSGPGSRSSWGVDYRPEVGGAP